MANPYGWDSNSHTETLILIQNEAVQSSQHFLKLTESTPFFRDQTYPSQQSGLLNVDIGMVGVKWLIDSVYVLL